ncbi:MAG: hypothetical protein GY887_12260 [Halieaceae bacterium]|nr:hypothetical protein [Halieaceae bacterium]
MKRYLTICAVFLVGGVVLGYFNGKYAAAARFADTCDMLRMVVVADRQSGKNRHFHCIEIDTQKAVDLPTRRALPPQQKDVFFDQRLNQV